VSYIGGNNPTGLDGRESGGIRAEKGCLGNGAPAADDRHPPRPAVAADTRCIHPYRSGISPYWMPVISS
jgi:hypothetical protein